MRGTEDRTGDRCSQCGARDPEHGLTTTEVIHRKWDSARRRQYVGRTRFTVCAGTPCAGHLQMAHEG